MERDRKKLYKIKAQNIKKLIQQKKSKVEQQQQ